MGQSAESAEMQSLKKGTKAAMIVADEPIAIRLKYVGTGTVTSVTNDISTDLELITSDGGTDTYSYTTYSTVGALENAINADGVFQAKVLDSLRSDATDDMFKDGAISLGTNGYYDVVVDTSAMKSLTYRCAYDRNVGSDVPAGNHRVALKEFTYFATLGGASVNDVQIWEYDRLNNIETQVYQKLSVSAAVTTINFASGKSEITGGYNNDLIVRLIDPTSLSDTGAYLQVRYERE